jgi:hypothetical protein
MPPLAYEIGQIRERLVNEIDIGRDSHEGFDDRIGGQISMFVKVEVKLEVLDLTAHRFNFLTVSSLLEHREADEAFGSPH